MLIYANMDGNDKLLLFTKSSCPSLFVEDIIKFPLDYESLVNEEMAGD